VIELLVIETTFNLASALRLFLVAAALRLDVSYAQSVTLVIALVAAAAIGFLPSGLGVREALAALLSPIIGLPASVGLVITAVDRVVCWSSPLSPSPPCCREARTRRRRRHYPAAPTTTRAHSPSEPHPRRRCDQYLPARPATERRSSCSRSRALNIAT
jgi:hypothetical protein